MQLTNVLIAPVITEKSSSAQASGKYTFRVRTGATKIEVAKAVEQTYDVKVTDVNIIPVLKKVRLAGRGKVITKRPASKKAIVTVAAKQSIDFNKVKTSSK